MVPGARAGDNSANVDLIAIYMTGVATLLLLAGAFIPGLRDVPRLVPVHRLVWRGPGTATTPGAVPGPPPGGAAGGGDAGEADGARAAPGTPGDRQGAGPPSG